MRDLILEACRNPALFPELQATFPEDLLKAEASTLGKQYLERIEQLYREHSEPVDDRQRIIFGGRQYVVVGPGRADLLHPTPEDKDSWLRKLAGCDLLFDPNDFPA